MAELRSETWQKLCSRVMKFLVCSQTSGGAVGRQENHCLLVGTHGVSEEEPMYSISIVG